MCDCCIGRSEIISILATDEYLEGIYVVPPIAAGVFIHALYDIFSAVSFFHKKSLNIMIATVTAAVVKYCTELCFYSGAWVLSRRIYHTNINIVLVVMHYWNICRIEEEKIYDGKFSLFIVLAVVTGCILCNFFYEFKLIRYF